MGIATAENFYVSAFYHLAMRRGLDADQLLKKANIPREDIDVPGKRIAAAKLSDLIIAIFDELQDESMSLSASPVPRGSFYMMGKLTIHEPTLEKALLQLKRFFGMVTKSYTIDLHSEDSTSYLMFELQNPELDEEHLFAEMNLMMFHRYSSWLIAENIPMGEVYFNYPPPGRVKEYAFLFPGKHVFNAASMGFSFPRRFLAHEIVQDLDTLKSFMRGCPMELFTQPKTDFSVTTEVYNLLKKQPGGQSFTLDEAADCLFLTKRTLIRRLKEEGSSFQEIKDLVRRDKAIYYLTSRNSSIGEIAGKIGYSDPSVFSRAFRTWTGVSPARYRADYLEKSR